MSDETVTQNKPSKPTPPKQARDLASFADPPLGGDLVEPVAFDKRARKTWHHAAEVVGLALSPAQLALAITALPLTSATKPGLVALLAGLVTGALASVLVQVPLLRYGIPLGVLARSTFGWRGARVFSATRLLVLVTFFASGVFLAAQTLWWCFLCATPSLVAVVQRITIVGGVSLLVLVVSALGAFLLWLVSNPPRAGVRAVLFLPSLLLVGLLLLLPDNLPFASAWAMLDVVGRAESSSVFGVAVLTFAWSTSVFLCPASETRHQPTQAGQMVAVLAGVLPWLLGTLSMALAILSSGQGGNGLFDLPSLACRRLSSAVLVPLLVTATIAYVWPLAHVTKRAALVSVQEILGARVGQRASRAVEYAVVIAGIGLALVARTRAESLLTLTMWAQLLVVGACLMMAAQYLFVDRTRLVLDDFYTLRGPYKGIAGVLPAGVLSLGVAVGAFVMGAKAGANAATSVALALLVGVIGQALFGSLYKLLRRP